MTTAIILLNWNGAADTIECLASLYRTTSRFHIVLVDNGSEDNSVARILCYLKENGLPHRNIKAGEQLDSAPAERECIVYEAGENLGFARGNNAGVRLLATCPPDRYLLLNNDTIVEADFLERLIAFETNHPEYSALTPLICYNNPRTLVWNAGGKQFFGLRKYYYAKRPASEIKEHDYIPVTFLTGCALYINPSALNAEGVPLTERFFFGEEDFDFCLRMNENHQKMACVLDSKIYHKVSASVQNKNSVGRVYINTLNRFIDLRLHWPLALFLVWALCYIPHLQLLMLRQRHRISASLLTPWRVFFQSFRQDAVTREDFIASK